MFFSYFIFTNKIIKFYIIIYCIEFRRTPAQPNQAFRNPNVDISLRASGRLTLREQQVMQLRREMMHPGGVRIQLRRKDCTSSIAFVDAFGAAWYVRKKTIATSFESTR